MNRKARTRLWVGLGFSVVVAAGALALGGVASPINAAIRAGAPTHAQADSREPNQPSHTSAGLARTMRSAKSSLIAQLLSMRSTQGAVHALENAPGAPACAPPPVPAATYPPTNSYGVPFLAAITGGQLLTAYSEWVADHHVYKVGGKNYDLYPWDVKIFDITGWVTGLLQLPSLAATIPPQDVVFCDQGGDSCLAPNDPQSECIHIDQLFPGPGTQGSEITNLHPPDVQCSGYGGGETGYPYPCVPYVITLTPSGNTVLTVTGVESDGALDLSVKTATFATVSIVSGATQTCQQDEPTSLTVSTLAPTSLPTGAPIAPKPGNPDYRSLQVSPLPLTGPIATASSTAGSNNFAIPAWGVPPTPSCPDPGLQESLNDPAGGYNTKNVGLYQDQTTPAGLPGWSQFSVTTTVVTLGFPVGPPPGFNF